MPKQTDEQIENWGVNFGRRSPDLGGHFSTPDHIVKAETAAEAGRVEEGQGELVVVHGETLEKRVRARAPVHDRSGLSSRREG